MDSDSEFYVEGMPNANELTILGVKRWIGSKTTHSKSHIDDVGKQTVRLK